MTEPTPAEHPTPAKRAVERYGWVPDLPDYRDHRYAVPAHVAANLPPSVDLRQQLPAGLYDQGDLGSCTANAIGVAIEAARIAIGAQTSIPSRLFIYYNERRIERTIDSDAGAMIRDGIKTVAKQGVCDETLWPYNIDQFTLCPPEQAYTAALAHRVTAYQRISSDLNSMRGALAAGHGFVIGFTVYNSFESTRVANTGVVNLPTAREKALGGHAVYTCGYDDVSQRFLVRNSWGPEWGLDGYFTVPYAYWSNPALAGDRWAITAIA